MMTPVMHILIDEEGHALTINRRVKVKMIVQKHLVAGESLSEIAEQYEIDLADVHAALTYYYDNKAAMDADMARAEALLEKVGTSGWEMHARIIQRTTSTKPE